MVYHGELVTTAGQYAFVFTFMRSGLKVSIDAYLLVRVIIGRFTVCIASVRPVSPNKIFPSVGKRTI